MSGPISTDQKAVVIFFGICCLSALTDVIRFVLTGTKLGVVYGLAQCIFIFFAGSAGWYLYKSVKAGWYLAFVVILNWFSSLLNLRVKWDLYYVVFSAGMLAVLVWLLRPKVKGRFGVRLGFS
jgi:hypothetical protein